MIGTSRACTCYLHRFTSFKIRFFYIKICFISNTYRSPVIFTGHWQYEILSALFIKQVPPFKQVILEQERFFSSQKNPLVPTGQRQLAVHVADEQLLVEDIHRPPFRHGDDKQALANHSNRKVT